MRRLLTALGVILAVGLLSAGLADASKTKAKLQVRKTRLGTILVTGGGYTVYAFSKDGRNHDACQNIPGCIQAWPIITGGGTLAGPGVKVKLIHTIKLGNGQKQLTYAGHPLYTYVGDSGPGDLSNVNLLQFDGRWPAVNAAGKDVK
jgi:predicted lipoprotein with Yx(FWY)xxD motif